MKSRQEIEEKAIELEKKIRALNASWNPTEAEEQKAEMLKTAYAALMYVLGYKSEAIGFKWKNYSI